jgi:glycosyltransferase involved in cell wall biosynthesis
VSGLRVLITNFSLSAWSGSETYVRDLALGLLRRGHCPVVYCPNQGAVAEALRAATVPVLDDLDTLAEPPDVIHAHHHPEAMTALLHFGGVPAVFCCHGRFAWTDAPPRFPRIRRYLAVDDTCRERLVCEHGIPGERVGVVLNTVDLERFLPRGPLPARPSRALLFSHYASEQTHLPAVREACARTGLRLDVLGLGVGNVCSRPEAVLGEYDFVFAKARCALEALAVGTAVVVCDATGVAGLARAETIARWRRFNLGCRLLQTPVTPEVLVREINRYDPGDAAEVSRRVRSEAGLDHAVESLIALYRTVIAEQREDATSPAEEARAAAVYLRWLSPWRQIDTAHQRANQVEMERARLQTEHLRVHASWAEAERQWQAAHTALLGEAEQSRDENGRLWAENDRLRAESDRLRAESERLRAENERLRAESERLSDELRVVHVSDAVRVGNRILSLPLLGRVTRRLLRRSA